MLETTTKLYVNNIYISISDFCPKKPRNNLRPTKQVLCLLSSIILPVALKTARQV